MEGQLVEVDYRPLGIVERVKQIPYLFASEYSYVPMLHFFIKRLRFSPSEYAKLYVEDRNELYELEKQVIEEENKSSEDKNTIK